MCAMITQDLHRAYRNTNGSRLRRLFECAMSPGVRAVILFRFRHWLKEQPLLIRALLCPFAAVAARRMRWKWGIDIGAEAHIGPGFMIIHYGGIFIAGDVVAGAGLTITHDITLGYSRAKKIQGFPELGNNVYIAPGAKLAGSIKIGDNVKIGANAVVEKDVPDNAVVQMRPALIVTFPEHLPAGIARIQKTIVFPQSTAA